MNGPDWRALTEDDIARHVLKVAEGRTARRLPGAKPSKYKAVKTTVDGITFDSKKEAQRYHELKMLEKAGQIRQLLLQVRFPLCVWRPHQEFRDVGCYVADFTYEESHLGEHWNPVVEDVKGFRTAIYRWKKKHFEAQYGIQIRET